MTFSAAAGDRLNDRVKKLRRIRLLLIISAAAVFVVLALLWLNWPRMFLQDPKLSHWASPTGAGTVSIYWRHALRDSAAVYVQPLTPSESLIKFGLFDNDDLPFDTTFVWSQDGQLFAAIDMPQWWYEVPKDRNGKVVEEPIYTHAYDFSTGASIGHTLGEGGSATDFLDRHADIEALFELHGGRGESFTVDDIRREEARLRTLAWLRWTRKMESATDPF